jgi:hypothetical protein
MKTLLLRVAMVGVLFLGMVIVSRPTVVKAGGCFSNVFCSSNDPNNTQLGTCSTNCFCNFPDGTREFNEPDCALL